MHGHVVIETGNLMMQYAWGKFYGQCVTYTQVLLLISSSTPLPDCETKQKKTIRQSLSQWLMYFTTVQLS